MSDKNLVPRTPRTITAALPGRLMILHDRMADFAVRGFAMHRPESRRLLERHARSFLHGFNTSVTAPSAGDAREVLSGDDANAEDRGFAFEGAAMACALFDTLSVSGGRRLHELLDGAGTGYPHLIHVGAGWALARVRLPGAFARLRLDPLLRWLALDGWGFSRGFFGGRRMLRRVTTRSRALSPAGQIRCQGLGRSLWFIESADPERIITTIGAAHSGRRAHLWSGIGLAAAYAGGATDAELGTLLHACGPYRAHLAQGAAFAAEARRRSGLIPVHTRSAVRTLAGVPAEEAADWTHRAAARLRGDGSIGDYLAWRTGIRAEAERTSLPASNL